MSYEQAEENTAHALPRPIYASLGAKGLFRDLEDVFLTSAAASERRSWLTIKYWIVEAGRQGKLGLELELGTGAVMRCS